jgi:8-oxo-dGTP pyrophosphatase MutT (NUDIX family)
MRDFIEKSLDADRDAVNRSKSIKKDMKVDVNLGTKAYQSPNNNLNENKNKVNKNAIIIIVNKDNKILLLKRSVDSKWMPEKWALLGGRVEKNESDKEAIIREIEEETGLEIKNPLERFEIKKNDGEIETVFVSRYDGDDIDVNLNDEHTNYGWFGIEEINFLDHVPNIQNYLELAFKEN